MRYALSVLITFMSLNLCGVSGSHYVGFGLGGEIMQAEQRATSTGNYAPVFIDSDYFNVWKAQLLDHAFNGSIFGGTTLRRGVFNLGIEAFLSCSSKRMKNLDDGMIGFSTAAEFNLDSEIVSKVDCVQYGLDLRPGFALPAGTFLYGRLGIEAVHLKHKIVNTNSGDALGDTWSFTLSESRKQRRVAWRVGGGLEKNLTNQLSLRLDYVYSDYGSISNQGEISGVSANGNPVSSTFGIHEHLYNHAVSLGLSYYLCKESPFLDNCCLKPSFCGAYAGGALGGGYCIKAQEGGAEGFQAQNPIEKVTESSPCLKDSPFQGQLFVGYGKQWHFIYFASELFCQGLATKRVTSFDTTFYQDSPNNNFFSIAIQNKMRFSPIQFGLDFRPGIRLLPTTLLYGRIGAIVARIKLESRGAMDGAIPLQPDFWALEVPLSQKITRVGFHTGLGLEQQLSSRWHLRMDYTFSDFRGIMLDGFESGFSTGGNPVSLSNQIKSDFTSHAFQIGLSWHFY